MVELMLPAHRLLQGLIANATQGLSKAAAAAAAAVASAARPQASDMLMLHLLHTVGAGAAARLAASESDGMRMVFEMLEGESACR